MMFDEPPSRPSARPFISSSLSAPTFPTFSSNGSPKPNPKFSPSPSSSYKNPRSSSSSATDFSYNYRITIALIPAAAFLLDLGGAPVAATLTLTLMIAYILDSLHLKSASFFAVWFALIASQIAFFFFSSPFSLFPSIPISLAALLLCGETNFLVGVSALLQFQYIVIENYSIVPALERLLFACVPVAAPPALHLGFCFGHGARPCHCLPTCCLLRCVILALLAATAIVVPVQVGVGTRARWDGGGFIYSGST